MSNWKQWLLSVFIVIAIPTILGGTGWIIQRFTSLTSGWIVGIGIGGLVILFLICITYLFLEEIRN